MNETVLCEKCGNEMVYFQEKHSCGWTCPNCGDGIVTTYLEPIERDETIYTVVTVAQEATIDAIRSSSKVFGCSFLEARKGLSDGSLSFSGKAREVQKMTQILKDGNVSFRIEPEYPYLLGEE